MPAIEFMTPEKRQRWFQLLFLLLLVNTAYIAALPSPTIFYMANVLLHLVLGLGLAIAAIFMVRRMPALGSFLIAAAVGLYLAITGNTSDKRWILWLHIGLGLFAVLALIPWVRRQSRTIQLGFAAAVALLVLLPATAAIYGRLFPNPNDRIRNPLTVPTTMQEEGGGPKSPFFPSSAKTNVGGTIPSNFFMDSKACGQCHADIYKQWNSSTHHFASFNNQFYRKAIEYMQDVQHSTQPSKWCAGCHDHAVFFNGRWEKPIKDQIDTPEAQNGLGCMSCHSIVHVDSSMGNGGFTMAYPPLHELASSKNKYMLAVNHFLTYLNPEPHRQSFMKPFMRKDASEFCATCHKVHLDVPVNNYRWFRGFNDYDNWQASGFGEGARSFYYPPKSMTCSGCHMPMVPSNDPGNHDGQIHSHRFPAANMALATVNNDREQLEATKKFLTSGFMSVDIFAVSPITEHKSDAKMVRRAGGDTAQIMSGMAVGEEAEQSGTAVIREVGQIAAPINHSAAALKPGETARIDVVVRTRKIGHFFPGGTVDSFDVWLELQGQDATGKTVFWSGKVEDNGKGAVEPGAHFYRAYQLDGDGNPISKRNAWQARSVLYVRLIQPGAADVAHFRVKIPKDAKGPITFSARLNYRKFTRYYTQFAYAGQPKAGQDVSLIDVNHNSADYSFDAANIPKNVSGQIKGRIPDLPIITIAKAEQKIPLGEPVWQPAVQKIDRERWNDWGIGLLLQGDLKGAEYAFRRVTEAEPGYADGWINVARALIQEGETEAARPFIDKALSINNSLGRAWFFKAMIQKAAGDYDGALNSLRTVEAKYPRDRVVLNQIARILFLKRDYAGALAATQRVCLVDPEDLQMHYTMMLSYRGLGDTEKASREEKLFRRFKAEESAQSLTAKRRMFSPEDNNERQQIHDHESLP